MNQPDSISAAMLRSTAAGLAGYAASDLLQSRPDLKQTLASQAFASWQVVLRDCLEELAAALSADRPQFFAGYLGWLQSMLTARGVPPDAVPLAAACLAKVVETELPAESGTRVAGVLRQALGDLEQNPNEVSSFLKTDTPHGRLAAQFLLALLEGDRAQASRLILDAAREGAAVEDLYLQVLLPVQQEVGRMWQADEINVAEGHFATATTSGILAQLRLRVSPREGNGRTVLAAAVAGNRHDLGVQMVGDFFELAGWRVIQLGPDMPIPDLAQAVEFYQPDLLALSVALHTQLPTLAETIQAVRGGQRGAKIRILVGGRGLAEAADLAAQFGADAYAADPQAAVAWGNSLSMDTGT